MLFNSFEFVFIFLPIVLIGYYCVIPGRKLYRQAWLVALSLCFLAYWRIDYLPVLLFSVAINYAIGRIILAQPGWPGMQTALLAAGIAINLGALCYFKYLFPMLGFLHSVGLAAQDWGQIVLPLGISFYTFTQIGYLIECKQGLVKSRSLLDYLLFATFFPHLIAGPILWNHDIMPQYAKQETYRFNIANLSTGLTWFILGLSKKCLIADNLAPAADYGFAQPAGLGLIASWHSVLSYSMQLYFDFSGYSDMAIGLALMFNVRFPLNFNSPYKASSIIDFWQRWHMSLTRYLTMYLYNPMALAITRRRAARGFAVSRKGARTPGGFASMIAIPTLFTMGLAGIWHGAGLQFIVFGLLHGTYLSINHAWRVFRPGPVKAMASWPSTAASVLATYLAVIVAQVFFRANSCVDAMRMLAGMVGLHGVAPGIFMQDVLLSNALKLRPMIFATTARHYQLADAAVLLFPIALALAWVWALPNTQQILAQARHSEAVTQGSRKAALAWRPNIAWAVALGALMMLNVGSFEKLQRFIYFQF